MWFLYLAIAVNNVDDTRPILDYYKKERGESRILETFKLNQAKLRAEEEEWNRQKIAQRNRGGLGRITPFSLQRKKTGHSQSKAEYSQVGDEENT